MYVLSCLSEPSVSQSRHLSACYDFGLFICLCVVIPVLINPFASGIPKVLLSHITGLFSVKIRKKFLAIKNFSVNDTMSGQPNKRLIHWHFEN